MVSSFFKTKARQYYLWYLKLCKYGKSQKTKQLQINSYIFSLELFFQQDIIDFSLYNPITCIFFKHTCLIVQELLLLLLLFWRSYC